MSSWEGRRDESKDDQVSLWLINHHHHRLSLHILVAYYWLRLHRFGSVFPIGSAFFFLKRKHSHCVWEAPPSLLTWCLCLTSYANLDWYRTLFASLSLSFVSLLID